jgi:hypothetical protein
VPQAVLLITLVWLPRHARAVDFKVSCSQIPRRAFARMIRTHDPLVESPTS